MHEFAEHRYGAGCSVYPEGVLHKFENYSDTNAEYMPIRDLRPSIVPHCLQADRELDKE